MTDNNLISIGMPVFNSERHIRQAIDSVLAQGYEQLELIISDNASTDATPEICREYVSRDPRVRFYRNDSNMGMSWNMNRVLELANGKYFKWAGSHDFVARSFVADCKQVLDSNPGAVLAYPLTQAVDATGEPIAEIAPEIIDTIGLSVNARVYTVIQKVRNYACVYYGLFRTSALRQCRPIRAFMGNDQVLLMEISILGTIALVPQVCLFRRYFGPVLDDRQRIATDLIRMNPELRKQKSVRPIWELGKQSIVGASRLAPGSRKVTLIPLVAWAFYSRWRQQLKAELWHPYSLQQYAEPNY
jgi:hypothetical protein